MREYLGRPVPAAAFLAVNGIVLYAVERLHRRQHPRTGSHAATADLDDATVVLPAIQAGSGGQWAETTTPLHTVSEDEASDTRLAELGWWEVVAVGGCQIFALLPGISRSGSTIAGGLLRGLRHDDAARFAFLLATPVIAAAGVLKIPDLDQNTDSVRQLLRHRGTRLPRLFHRRMIGGRAAHGLGCGGCLGSGGAVARSARTDQSRASRQTGVHRPWWREPGDARNRQQHDRGAHRKVAVRGHIRLASQPVEPGPVSGSATTRRAGRAVQPSRPRRRDQGCSCGRPVE